eukprot:gene17051-8565_t
MVYWRGTGTDSPSKYIGNKKRRNQKVTLRDQFLLVLMRFRLGFMNEELAARFRISPGCRGGDLEIVADGIRKEANSRIISCEDEMVLGSFEDIVTKKAFYGFTREELGRSQQENDDDISVGKISSEDGEDDDETAEWPDVEKNIYGRLAKQTNRYAQQLKTERDIDKSWQPTTLDKIQTFVGMRVYMSVVDIPELRMYWSEDKVFGNFGISEVMPRLRFKKLCQYFHANDRAGYNRQDPN